MDPDRLALHQHRLERLDAQAVQRGRAVQEHRVVLDDFFQDLVHLRRLLSTIFFARLTLLAIPFFTSLLMMKGLKGFTAIALGNPNWCRPSFGPNTIPGR